MKLAEDVKFVLYNRAQILLLLLKFKSVELIVFDCRQQLIRQLTEERTYNRAGIIRGSTIYFTTVL